MVGLDVYVYIFLLYPRHPVIPVEVWSLDGMSWGFQSYQTSGGVRLDVWGYILRDHVYIRFIRNPNPYHPCMIYIYLHLVDFYGKCE